MPTLSEIRASNEAFIDMVTDDGRRKQAADTVNGFTRVYTREDSIMDKCLPPLNPTDEDIVPELHDDAPTFIIEKDPYQPPAVTASYGTAPMGHWFKGNRYRLTCARIMTRRFQKDVSELRTYRMDLREHVAGNAARDLLTVKDTRFIAACNAAMVGADTVNPENDNQIHWETIHAPVTRESLIDAKKCMARGLSSLEPVRAVVNNIFIKEVEKEGRDEVGGDLSEDLWRKGFAVIEEMHGMEWLVTIKDTLVPDDAMFMFADPEWLGKHYELQPPTSHLEVIDSFIIKFFLFCEGGHAIGNASGVARADFTMT